MDFKKLMQTMQQIEEGCDPSLEECGGDMPVVMQGGHPPEESLNMNLTINSKGADGIRELLDVLKGIDGTEPKDKPRDNDQALFGIDKDSDHEKHVVIGDDFENSVEDDEGPKVFDQDTMFPVGDDLASKGREALKRNGGGNPLAESLHALYEEIKNRSPKIIKSKHYGGPRPPVEDKAETKPTSSPKIIKSKHYGGPRPPINEDEASDAAIAAWLASGNTIKQGRTKRNKKEMHGPRPEGEHPSGLIHSANARTYSTTKKPNVIDVKASEKPDWRTALDDLAAIGNKWRAEEPERRAREEEERERQEEIERHIQHIKALKRQQKLDRIKNTKWTPTRLQDK